MENNRDKKSKNFILIFFSLIGIFLVIFLLVGSFILWKYLLPFGANNDLIESNHSDGSTIFMSYAGPVFPLSLSENNDEIVANRHVIYDFSLPSEDSSRIWGAQVQDNYILSNISTQDQEVKVIYPFTGSFSNLEKLLPTISLESSLVKSNLYPGPYSGGFEGLEGSSNLKYLDNWEAYKKLFENGSYEKNTFSPKPELNQNVIVYEFSDYIAPLDEYPAATEAISFNIDPNKTTIFQYGFEGIKWGKGGFREYSYFIPDKITKRSNRHILIVLGDDINTYSLKGYKDGATETDNELDGISSTITRYEVIFSDIVKQLIDDYFSQYKDNSSLGFDKNLYFDAVTEFLYQYSILANNPADRYQGGRLMDIISEVNVLDRVFYLEFPLTIPRENQINIGVNLHKDPSFNFHHTYSRDTRTQGYDLVTQIGSNLHFKEIIGEIININNLKITKENFTFDPLTNKMKVSLDPNIDHYYFEIK